MQNTRQEDAQDLTARNTFLERQIKQSNEQLQFAMRAAKLGTWSWDIPTNVVNWSSNVAAIFGLPSDGFDGTFEAYLNLVHPDDRGLLLVLVQQAQQDGIPYHVEHRIISPGDEVRWLECDGQVFFESAQPISLSGTVRDITERKKAEFALQVSEQQYRALFEQSYDGVILHDVATGTVLTANQALADMLSCEVSDLVGTSYLDDVHPDELADAQKRWSRVLVDGHLAPYERRLITHNGEHRYFEITASTIYDTLTRVPRFVQVVLRDITERKQIERQMQVALMEKEILLKEIHHRVKNNLQVVSSLLYLQSQKINDPGLRELFRESQNRVQAMALVHEQLYQSEDFARVDFGAYLRMLISTLFEAYGTDQARISLEIFTDGAHLDVHTAIPCGLMVSEMISNSLKYAFPDNNLGEITVSLRLEDEDYCLIVQDNGIGFNPNTPVRPGSLGLQLVDRLVAQIGGKLNRTGPPGVVNQVNFPQAGKERL